MLKKAAIIASLPLFLAVARFMPWERLPSPCMFLRITGLPCPSCGMTRSVIALTHLDFARAWYMNPLGVALIGILGVWWVCSLYEISTGRSTRMLSWAGRRTGFIVGSYVIIMVWYGVQRIVHLLNAP